MFHLRLGCHVTHTEAVRPPAETAVRDQGHVLAEAGAHDQRGRVEHLLHAWAALGPLVPDDNDGALQDQGSVKG